MGILDLRSALPNSTKCDTWPKAEASHTKTKIVQLRLQDIYGPLILLSGLAIGTLVFFIEVVGGRFKNRVKHDGSLKEDHKMTNRRAWAEHKPELIAEH